MKKCDKFEEVMVEGVYVETVECLSAWGVDVHKMDYGRSISLDLWILIIYILGEFYDVN